ncbi:hypothetical protein [Cellulomonas sp.]|uniref:hypothetical protein n=1 Tax=Cellulomonas sp. TaxID=40001 RepID=UPI003BA99BE2
MVFSPRRTASVGIASGCVAVLAAALLSAGSLPPAQPRDGRDASVDTPRVVRVASSATECVALSSHYVPERGPVHSGGHKRAY